MRRGHRRLAAAAAALLSSTALSTAQEVPEKTDPVMPLILPLKDRAAVTDAWLKERLDTLVGPLMRREGVDMWILFGGEYNEDPVLKTMLPATWLSARRTTILVFHDRGEDQGVDRFAIARYPVADLFPSAWNPDEQPDQMARLAEIVAERNPDRIAVNTSDTFPLADGLTAADRDVLTEALGDAAERIVAKPALALGWFETRIPAEMTVYPMIVRIAHSIIAETFSEANVVPGVTTTNDLRWHLRQRVSDLGLDTWFHPSVHVQRVETGTFAIAEMNLDGGQVIEPGDLLHVDFGITYLGFSTDTQHHAYVLRPGETQAPKGLRAGLTEANEVQDALVAEFEVGLTGNELLTRARRRALRRVAEPSIYSHPIGFHGHGAGPWIGMWDDQETAGLRGEVLVRPNTAWSIESNAQVAVPEWGGQTVRFMTEEDAFFDGETVRYLDGRQRELLLIPRQ
jgi:hypothetical protein